MAAQASITLNTKVYTPRGKNAGDIATWALAGDTTFGGATSYLTEKVSNPNTAGVTRVTFKVTIPKAATADSACGCVGQELYRGTADISVSIPSGFTAAERDDFTKRVQGLVANAVYSNATTNLEGSW